MNWRPGTESNRRIGALQAPALPLCYLAFGEVGFLGRQNIVIKKIITTR